MNKYIMGYIAAAALTLNTACTDDLNQYPHNETTSEQVYTNVQNYEAVLGKIYASMTATGQESSGVDYASNHGENYMRMFINLQEGPTDEMAYSAHGRRYDQHLVHEVGRQRHMGVGYVLSHIL